jgi:hypothetical protein
MNMREKMARAIFEGPPSEWDRMDPIIRAACFRQADAALAALEEPTEAMMKAGTYAYIDREGEWGIYRAMIRKAKEG